MRKRQADGSIKQWGHEVTKAEAELIFRAEMEVPRRCSSLCCMISASTFKTIDHSVSALSG